MKKILYFVGLVLVVGFLYDAIKDIRTTHTYLEFAIAGTAIGFVIKQSYITYQRLKNLRWQS